MTTELIFTVVIIFLLVTLIDKVYSKINLEQYSPKWEYFFKALLYGFIATLTLFFGKESLKDVTMLEWAIVAVSLIEGIGNYINYVKEAKKIKVAKVKSLKI